MSVTVASLYNIVCYDLLEDFGLALGIVTQQEFLDMLGLVLMDFLQRTAIIRRPYTQRILSTQSVYPIPEANPELFDVFYNGILIDQTDVFVPGNVNYPTQTGGTPSHWHQDQLSIQNFEILPIPNFNGVNVAADYDDFQPGDQNVTGIVSSLASKETWGANDTLDTIPDSFTPYLVYGILEKIFTMDGESKDNQRALYCRARYEEGVALAKAVVRQYLMEPEQ